MINNAAAKVGSQNATIFTLLVVISGGAHAALCVVSVVYLD